VEKAHKKLRKQVSDVFPIKHYSYKTEKSYVHWNELLIPILKTSKNDRNAEMIVYSQFRSTKSPVTFENWYHHLLL
jgi:hypothetical protein